MSKSKNSSFNHDREHMHRQLFSAVSHDLKTPLASIIGSLEIHQRMHNKLGEDKKQLLISTALQEAYRLDNFITNMLDMGKLENGMVVIRTTDFSIKSMIEDCLTVLDNRLIGCQLLIEASTENIIIHNDAALLCRALTLLVDNAVKYGGEPPSLIVRYDQLDNGQVTIEVQDNGQGIADSYRDSIFEKYTRFARSDHQNAGTGLGLPICRAIMQLLGGTVTLEPSNGGARFMLTIPSLSI